jgi:hypothetical protein
MSFASIVSRNSRVKLIVSDRVNRLVPKPGAGNRPARFDERDVETEHGLTLRHWQSKEPATAMQT